MNKFSVLPLVILVLVLGADAAKLQSKAQKASKVLDSMEVMELSGDEEASSAVYMPGEQLPASMPMEHIFFRDFCIGAQDEIKAYVMRKINGVTSNVYTIMLTSASDVGSEVLRAHSRAVHEGSQVIQEAATVAKDARTAQDIDDNVHKTLENMAANPRLFQRVGSAIRLVIGVVTETARSLVFQRIAQLKEQLGTNQLRGKIEEACASIEAELLPRVNQRLSATKQALQQELSGQLLAKVQAANPNTVGCTLSGRVWKVAKFCEILKAAGPAIYSLVGIN